MGPSWRGDWRRLSGLVSGRGPELSGLRLVGRTGGVSDASLSARGEVPRHCATAGDAEAFAEADRAAEGPVSAGVRFAAGRAASLARVVRSAHSVMTTSRPPSSPPSSSDLQLGFYEQFFFSKNLEPYPIQEQAFDEIFAGKSVLVTVPTGTGKTMMAKSAIYKALQCGQTAVYTTPLRALTEEKYRELSGDFGEDKVGFATGDYKVRPEAPVQVVVAEILWNRIFSDRVNAPANVVIMDEGHYFNDFERGYVWEQSIIGLDPRSQLVILSATIGDPDRFCQWVYLTRRIEMSLVQSLDRRVPLYHQYRESYLIEVAKELFFAGEVPAIVFTFGREQCFERARILKSCPRFTTDEERVTISRLCDEALLDRGLAKELKPLLLHGIGVHHAGILPRYKQLVERLTLERLLKFVVSTETISASRSALIRPPSRRATAARRRRARRSRPLRRSLYSSGSDAAAPGQSPPSRRRGGASW